MNVNHNKAIPANSYIFQTYIVDKAKGLYPPKGIDVPDGSWIVGVKVEDKDVWDGIKAGKINGFSIEGQFEQIEVSLSNQEINEEEKLMNLLNQFNQIITNSKK